MTEFITKDSGKRQEYNSGMKRDIQDNKPRFDLILPLEQPYDETLLYRWGMLLERGMTKYGYRNWEKANSLEEFNRFKASAWRHFVQAMNGETDEDHLAAIVFNLNAICFLQSKLKIKMDGTPQSL
jgi:hypothetical protein